MKTLNRAEYSKTGTELADKTILNYRLLQLRLVLILMSTVGFVFLSSSIWLTIGIIIIGLIFAGHTIFHILNEGLFFSMAQCIKIYHKNNKYNLWKD